LQVNDMTMVKVGLLFDRAAVEKRFNYGLNVFQLYTEEILAHAGIPFEMVESADRLSDYKIVIAGITDDDPETMETLWRFAENGGALIAYRGLDKMARKLQCLRSRPSGVGYMRPDAGTAGGNTDPLRFLQAEVWHPQANDPSTVRAYGTLHADTPDGRMLGPALLSFRVGRGSIHRWAVDIPTTVVHFQQGSSPVLYDGIPAQDGTGDVDDSILKVDDRYEMDWELDRAATETGMLYFRHPYGDYWRDVMIGHLLRTAREHGWVLPFVDPWPDGVEQVALISFDSDQNRDESAVTTLELLREMGIPTTWCLIEPGFSPEICRRAAAEGHELALHYNALAMENGRWSREELHRQYTYVKQATGFADIVSNKNHYTRYEGWGELFRWLEACGIQTDQTRGPSKKGNIGFLYGTCRPYRPIAWFDERNRLYDVLEVGFLTQDLNHPTLADDSVAEPFLDQVRKMRGVAHFLFHQIHIHTKPAVREALRKVIREARRRGFEFWTNRQINDWERSRRKLRVLGIDGAGEIAVEHAGLSRDAVVWLPAEDDASDTVETRYGIPCRKRVVRAGADASA
jgi:peptidoglycan/xylan/chitin deacetylase (PgdA/CDA1 family)